MIRLLQSLFVVILLLAMPVLAPAQDAMPLPAETQSDFEARLQAIDEQVLVIRDLQARAASEETELLRDIFRQRSDSLLADVFENTMALAQDVVRQRDAGFDVASLEASLAADLEPYPPRALMALERIGGDMRFAAGNLEPAEVVRLDQELLSVVTLYDDVLASLVMYTEIADVLGLDASEEVNFLRAQLPENAANRSAFLSLSLNRVGVTRAAAATLPDNASLNDRALAAAARVRIASSSLQNTVRMMDAMDLDTRVYRQQILTATGEVTTDVLDVGILRGLLVEWSGRGIAFAQEQGPRLLLKLLLFALILFISSRLGRLAKRIVRSALTRGKDVRLSHLLQQMIVGSIGNIVFLIGLMIGLSQLGIALGPLLAGLGIVGFIVGFALQDTLSNFASGMMILMYRPFDVGDFVTAAGISGRVEKMSLVNSTFKTFDNQVLLIPNSQIWGSVITNYTDQAVRRVDLTFRIGYEEDFARVESVIREVLADYDKILDDPVPNIRVNELGEYAMDVIVRPWVQTEDYWDTAWDLKRLIKERFDAEGIMIPVPRRTVRLVPDPGTPQS